MIFNAGELNRKIQIVGTLPDTSGTFTENKERVICTCWASISPLRGREYYDADIKRDDGQVKITIRYRKGIDATCKVKYLNHVYVLNCPPVDPFMEHSSLELYCTETTRGASLDNNNGGWKT